MSLTLRGKMNLQRLSIFRSVYETLSLSQTARNMHLAQPTVSRHLRIFEDEVGLALFINEKGRLKATREADVLYFESEGTFEKVAQIEASLHQLKTGKGETIRIMTVPSLLAYQVLPNAIAAVKKYNPDVHIEVDIGGGAMQTRALREGTAHVGLAAGVSDTGDLVIEKIGEGEVIAIVPREHSLAGASEFPLKDLANIDCVLPSRRGPVGRLFFEKLHQLGVEPRYFVTAVSPAIATGLVTTLNCCAISDNFASSLFSGHELELLPLSEKVRFDVQLLISPNQVIRSSLDAFLRALKYELSRVTSP
ncbi:LysR family transcriptional regulator [Hoeflea sp. CAU 1731]